MEIWKEIIGYPKYFVSNFGRLKSTKNNKETYLTGGKTKTGYTFFCLYNNKKDHIQMYIHRLVGIYFIRAPLIGECINHKDGNKNNNNVTNLEWCNHVENMKHGYKNKLIISKGERNGMAKISEKDALDIISRVLKKERYKSIIKDYQISAKSVSDIFCGRTWKHLNRSKKDLSNIR